jgi:hypothetical protein
LEKQNANQRPKYHNQCRERSKHTSRLCRISEFCRVPLSFVPSMDNGSDIFSIISKMMDLWDKRPFTFHLSDIHVDADSKDSAI